VIETTGGSSPSARILPEASDTGTVTTVADPDFPVQWARLVAGAAATLPPAPSATSSGTNGVGSGSDAYDRSTPRKPAGARASATEQPVGATLPNCSHGAAIPSSTAYETGNHRFESCRARPNA